MIFKIFVSCVRFCYCCKNVVIEHLVLSLLLTRPGFFCPHFAKVLHWNGFRRQKLLRPGAECRKSWGDLLWDFPGLYLCLVNIGKSLQINETKFWYNQLNICKILLKLRVSSECLCFAVCKKQFSCLRKFLLGQSLFIWVERCQNFLATKCCSDVVRGTKQEQWLLQNCSHFPLWNVCSKLY